MKANKNVLCVFIIALLSIGNVMAQVPKKAKDISPLLIGEELPIKTKLKNADGKEIVLKNILKEKPTVLVFYRGGWCPYCNKQLAGLAQISPSVVDLGYQIVAISPDYHKNIPQTEQKNDLDYTVYSDENSQLIKKVGIAFKTPSKIKLYVATKKHEGKVAKAIPVPTVMVVNEKGKILFEYINPDYSERMNENMLMAVLQSLKKDE